MDFISLTFKALPGKRRHGGGFGSFEHRLHRKQSQTRSRSGLALDAVRIMHLAAQHLITTAYPQDIPAIGCISPKGIRPTGMVEPLQITARTFTTRQDHSFEAVQGLALFKVSQLQPFQMGQGIEIIKIGNVGQFDHRHRRRTGA